MSVSKPRSQGYCSCVLHALFARVTGKEIMIEVGPFPRSWYLHVFEGRRPVINLNATSPKNMGQEQSHDENPPCFGNLIEVLPYSAPLAKKPVSSVPCHQMGAVDLSDYMVTESLYRLSSLGIIRVTRIADRMCIQPSCGPRRLRLGRGIEYLHGSDSPLVNVYCSADRGLWSRQIVISVQDSSQCCT
ncbi:hypothetical protein F4859DRAFT_86459 [Xylaria cf. heliscus]|nr:hypothetical protein F4859DRAFT_86459 [Xylaria cf. heliscus]